MKDHRGVESKAALAPGKIIPAAGEPWEEKTVPRPESVPYRKLFRWGWYVVSVALGWFLTNTILSLPANPDAVQCSGPGHGGVGAGQFLCGRRGGPGKRRSGRRRRQDGRVSRRLPARNSGSRGHHLCHPRPAPHSPAICRTDHHDLVRQLDGGQTAAAPARQAPRPGARLPPVP